MTFEPQKRGWSLAPMVHFFYWYFFHCFAYLLRVYPGIYGDAIRSHLGISEASFSLLAAMYYFAYAPMQVPVGVLVDRIGPRMSLILACFVAIGGGAFFALSDQVGVAMVGRFLVGLGTAFAYVTGLKLAAMWLPKRWFATATGMVTAFGMIAAATSYNINQWIRLDCRLNVSWWVPSNHVIAGLGWVGSFGPNHTFRAQSPCGSISRE